MVFYCSHSPLMQRMKCTQIIEECGACLGSPNYVLIISQHYTSDSYILAHCVSMLVEGILGACS